MVFGKKKKEEKELAKKLEELNKPEEEETLPTAPKEEKKETKKEPEPIGKFSLNPMEMALSVEALAERPELKVYNDFIIGQQIAKIITDYNKSVGNKEELPAEDEGSQE